jgi:hypothetical protein
MKFRFARRLAAGLAVAAAVCLSPARSKADVQILVQEYTAGPNGALGSLVGQSFTNYNPGQVAAANGILSYSYSSAASNSEYVLGGFVSTSSFNPADPNASLNPSFSGGFKSGFTPASASGPLNILKVTVTDDSFNGRGGDRILTNDGATTNGTLTVSTYSQILDQLTVPASSNASVATGTVIGGPTGETVASRPGSPSDHSTPPVSVSSLPDTYAVQQVLTVTVDPTSASTFGGSGGANVSPVPAPGGLALALIGLPLIGLRRALRKRPEVA